MQESVSLGTGAVAPAAEQIPAVPSARPGCGEAADSEAAGSWAARRWPAAGWAAGGVGAVIVVAAGAAAGLWFVPFLLGLAGGVAARRARLRAVLPAVAGAAVVGWAVPLAWQAAGGEPVGATAAAVGALAGLPPSAALILGITLLVPAIQAATGVWLARAVARARPRPGA
jgi:hypothetical protein